MITLLITVLVLGIIILNLDKLKYLKYFIQFIWGTVKSIPTLIYAGLKLVEAGLYLIKAGLLYSFYFTLTWGFWPLAIWLIFCLDLKGKH